MPPGSALEWRCDRTFKKTCRPARNGANRGARTLGHVLRFISFWCACWVVLSIGRSAHAADASPAGLTLETGSPDAWCPDLAATRRAVSDRLGTLALEGEQSWVARYTIGHAPDGGGDFVQLVLHDGQGVLRLERILPVHGEACDTLAQAIALVLERYFRALQTPVTEPATPAEAPPKPGAVSSPPDAPVRPMARPLTLAAELGLSLGSSTAVLGLRFGAWFGDWFQASLAPQVLLPPETEALTDAGRPRGSASVMEVPLRVGVGLGRRTTGLAWRAGPELRFSLRRASTEGVLILEEGNERSGDASGTGWAFAVGASAGVVWWPVPVLGFSAGGAIDATVSETRFEVRAGSDPARRVLASPNPQGQILFGVVFGAEP